MVRSFLIFRLFFSFLRLTTDLNHAALPKKKKKKRQPFQIGLTIYSCRLRRSFVLKIFSKISLRRKFYYSADGPIFCNLLCLLLSPRCLNSLSCSESVRSFFVCLSVSTFVIQYSSNLIYVSF